MSCSVWFRIQRIIQNCPGNYSASGSVFRVLFKIRPAASGSGFSVLLKNDQGIIQRLVQYSGYYSKYDLQRLVQDSAYYSKCPGYYSASGSVFRVVFEIRAAASGSGFSVLFKNVQGIIQRLVQYSGYYSKDDLQRLVQDSAYYSKLSRELFSVRFSILGIIKIRPAASGSGFSVLFKMFGVLFSVWFSILGIIRNTSCSVLFRIQRIIQKCPGYYSASGSVFRVFFKIRPAASGSGFSVLFKTVQGIIQRLVQYSGYYSKYDLQRLVQDSA